MKSGFTARYFYRNNKISYYLKNVWRYFVPKKILQKKLPLILAKTQKYDETALNERVDYCNKYNKNYGGGEEVQNNGLKLSEFKYVASRKKRKYGSVFFFDTYQYTRFFDGNLKMLFDFDDIRWNKEAPTLTKTRSIIDPGVYNNILLKLDKSRHFLFIEDRKDFIKKKNKLIGRGAVFGLQFWRIDFYKKYFGHSMCDLGDVSKEPLFPEWKVKPISKPEHLEYKFILCLEGNDVATNLKWAMSSNSLAVMPKPKCESWFMEGKLKGGFHYVEIKDDYSDLEERLNYYIEHPSECLQIIENAHKWCRQFQNEEYEDLCSLLVLQKYFKQTGQL
jgi:hypothetical protein